MYQVSGGLESLFVIRHSSGEEAVVCDPPQMIDLALAMQSLEGMPLQEVLHTAFYCSGTYGEPPANIIIYQVLPDVAPKPIGMVYEENDELMGGLLGIEREYPAAIAYVIGCCTSLIAVKQQLIQKQELTSFSINSYKFITQINNMADYG